jgi:transposase
MAVAVDVVGGVDPHADTFHVAVVTATGRAVGDAQFPATAEGYRSALGFLSGAGVVDRIGVEGAAGYGAGLTRALSAAGIDVVEVERPSRSARRRAGKSDRLDAYHAARAVLAQRSSPIKDPAVEGLRALHVARRSAVKARTATMNQIHAILIMAPEPLRAGFRGLTGPRLVQALRRCRRFGTDPVGADTMVGLKLLAQRYRQLSSQIEAATVLIDARVSATNPALRDAVGVGPDSAAQLLITAGHNLHRLGSEAAFAALCGAAPVPASSGKTCRHRLSRGGDRAANAALHRIALVRMKCHAPTQAYAARRKAQGRSGLEILRLLKRAIAREIYQLLTRSIPRPDQAAQRRAERTQHLPPQPTQLQDPASPPFRPERRRGQDAAPHRTNDLDTAEHRPTLATAGAG